jgi:hypothetical protein
MLLRLNWMMESDILLQTMNRGVYDASKKMCGLVGVAIGFDVLVDGGAGSRGLEIGLNRVAAVQYGNFTWRRCRHFSLAGDHATLRCDH